MARLIFENLTLEQAIELAHWYEGQGEQDAADWFDCANDISPPMVNVRHEKWLNIDEANQEVIVQCR